MVKLKPGVNILSAVAAHLGWGSPYVEDCGIVRLCGVMGNAVFYITMGDNGCLDASCVACNGSFTKSNSFKIHVSDPDIFDKLKSWMGSFDNDSVARWKFKYMSGLLLGRKGP